MLVWVIGLIISHHRYLQCRTYWCRIDEKQQYLQQTLLPSERIFATILEMALLSFISDVVWNLVVVLIPL